MNTQSTVHHSLLKIMMMGVMGIILCSLFITVIFWQVSNHRVSGVALKLDIPAKHTASQ